MTVMDPGDEPPPFDSAVGWRSSVPDSGMDPARSTDSAARTPPLTDAQVEAFSDFYRSDVRDLVVFVRVQGATWAEAADAAQEAMIKAYRRWGSLTRPKAWVRTVATREFIRHRVDLREDSTPQIPEPTSALLRDPAASAAAEAAEEFHIQQLLDQLPSRQRQVLAWTYDGYTPTEIAEQLSTPHHSLTPDAVRASLKLARRTLAQQLDPGEDER